MDEKHKTHNGETGSAAGSSQPPRRTPPAFVGMGASIALGAALGIVIGTILGNFVFGLAAGAALGTVAGAVVESCRKR
ncbi:MAG: hypothetical protein ACM3ZC_11475 [Bacteroidota bacterium]